MHKLIKNLPNPELIKIRLQEFATGRKQDNSYWFSELCFCILTANAQAERALLIQQELGPQGFLENNLEQLSATIKKFGHRFHNRKAEYIVFARQYKNIKEIIINMSGPEARIWIVKNIKGIGYKEASHFLRNMGWSDVAIIDRHILRFMYKNKLIENIPKTVTPKIYIDLENILIEIHPKQDELDLILWYHMTGKILK